MAESVLKAAQRLLGLYWCVQCQTLHNEDEPEKAEAWRVLKAAVGRAEKRS